MQGKKRWPKSPAWCDNSPKSGTRCPSNPPELSHALRFGPRELGSTDTRMHRPPEQLPDPWLFDSEKLLRELDRCREMVLLIPATNQETHFAVNNAISSIWNLRETLRYLLGLHRDAQRAFAKKHGHSDMGRGKRNAPAIAAANDPARMTKFKAASKARGADHRPAA